MQRFARSLKCVSAKAFIRINYYRSESEEENKYGIKVKGIHWNVNGFEFHASRDGIQMFTEGNQR